MIVGPTSVDDRAVTATSSTDGLQLFLGLFWECCGAGWAGVAHGATAEHRKRTVRGGHHKRAQSRLIISCAGQPWPAVSQPDRATLQKTNVLSVCPWRPPPPLGSSPLFRNSLPTRQTPPQNPSSEPPSAMMMMLMITLVLIMMVMLQPTSYVGACAPGCVDVDKLKSSNQCPDIPETCSVDHASRTEAADQLLRERLQDCAVAETASAKFRVRQEQTAKKAKKPGGRRSVPLE